MCNLMHRGGLDNILQLIFWYIYYCISVVNSYIYTYYTNMCAL